ncbi:MAG: DEAD/DEAH box helicase family protein, partial [Treponema sp.]|nr:DEAD/DEAH box helicase family protein [Treponema sp.]
MSPEARARQIIDKKLAASGWLVQDYKGECNPAAAPGVAVREFPTKSGPADYMLFVDKTPAAVVEAKKSDEGHNITAAETQTLRYANSSLKWQIPGRPVRFVYEATGILTRFTDYADMDGRSREVFSFHRPETLLALIKKDTTLRNRLKSFPAFDSRGFRDCQTRAIIQLEKSFAANKPRALIQMATGAGKTFAAITSVYRLLKHAKAGRVLFLVDTKNLGQQAEQEFLAYTPNDAAQRFPELYNVRRLNSSYIPADSHVCISTIQRMYSILRGENLDESLEEESPNEQRITGNPREVAYNEKYPPEFFDFIIIDECHRSIYNIWQQVLDYFDAFLIGLTATPDKRTFGFFNENLVSEYSHEQAVIDNVNVGYDIFLIETEISKKGAAIAKQLIERRERLSRKKRWEQLDEDIVYSKELLDRDVVNPSQIRNVIKAFRDSLPVMFPGRKEIPKTIIFAKNDSHADDIIQIAREEFGLGNKFCRKITYRVEKADSVLGDFRNDYNPRIAVTVDMIATGTDVKPVECLLFMRDVRSRSYFEQMKGRGTRTLDKEDLLKVTLSARGNKTHFVIVDAVGVTKSLKTDSRHLERKPGVPLKDLMMSIALGSRDEDVFLSLANRLTRLDKELSESERDEFKEHSGGVSLRDTVQKLLDTFNPDALEEQNTTQAEMAEAAAAPFYLPQLRTFIEDARKALDQIIDTVNIDRINTAAWDAWHSENAAKTIGAFRDFINANKNNIIALSIIYSQSWKNRPLTLDMIEELYAAMQKPPYNLSAPILWQAYETSHPEKVKSKSPESMLADIVSLLRFELGIDQDLRPFSDMVDSNFR